jgi:hypothetical protein
MKYFSKEDIEAAKSAKRAQELTIIDDKFTTYIYTRSLF